MKQLPGPWMVIVFFALTIISGNLFANDHLPVRPLKVLTLNFNSEDVISDANFAVRDKRFNALKKWVKDNDPDIILLEEAWVYRNGINIAASLANAIGYDVNYRIEMGLFKFLNEANAVLTKKNLAMTDHYAIKLPHSAYDLGNGTTWQIELGAVSYAVGAKLKMSNGEPLYVFATHLTGKTPSHRADQAAAIIAFQKSIAAKDGIAWDKVNVVVSGDFNSIQDESAPLVMEQNGFVDSFREVNPEDTSCTICQVPTSPWFNPFSIGAGLFPSQNDEDDALRIDYIFSHGPSLVPIASTITFTAPLNGMWMSDHYGVTSVFAGRNSNALIQNNSNALVQNAAHDSEDTIPTATIQTITADMLNCSHIGICFKTLKAISAQGARGVVIANRGAKKFYITVKGPGNIFSKNSVWLNPGEQAAFTFGSIGNYNYNIKYAPALLSTHLTELNGVIQVPRPVFKKGS
jgi:endonuclease/exonuclease/phosphatase family metal-dependent hydrolase